MGLDKGPRRRKLSGKEGGAGGTPPALSEAQLRAVRSEIYATYSDWRINAIVAHLGSLVALLERAESRQLNSVSCTVNGARPKPNVSTNSAEKSTQPQLELYPPGDDEEALASSDLPW